MTCAILKCTTLILNELYTLRLFAVPSRLPACAFHCFQVLVETPLAVFGKEFLHFSKTLTLGNICYVPLLLSSPSAWARASSLASSTRCSRGTGGGGGGRGDEFSRILSLAVHAILKATEVSADSHHIRACSRLRRASA